MIGDIFRLRNAGPINGGFEKSGASKQSLGGAYYPMGQALSNMVNKHADGYQMVPIVTGGGAENPRLVDSGEVDLGIAPASLSFLAVNGKGPYPDPLNITAMGVLHSSVLHMVTLPGSGIEDIEDLKGKRVAIGPAGGGTISIMRKSLEQGAMAVLSIAAACAAAGIVSGVLSMTGVGSKISGLIIDISAGQPLIALGMTALMAIILGMGLPTTAAYLILATVVAPPLVEMGVPILTAHMFVFFFGCISTITPPVALASYVAAGIAGSDINRTSWTAFAYGITSYILPFMFFLGPALLMDGTVFEIVTAVVIGLISVYCIATAVVGYFLQPLGIIGRIAMASAGLLLLYQSMTTNVAGLAILIGMVALVGPRYMSRKKG